MRVPINMGVKGKVTVTLTNIETGEKQEVKGDNLILNHYLDWAMERGLGILGDTTFNRCYIGTGDTPPQPGDTTFNGTQLAMSSSPVTIKTTQSPRYLFDPLNITNIPVTPANRGFAVIPEDNILIIGTYFGVGDDSLSAFKYDDITGDLTKLEISDFNNVPTGTGCSGISYNGGYLIVGLTSAPWGQVYSYNEGDFTFVGNIPGLTSQVITSAVSPDGSFFAVGGEETLDFLRVYKIEQGDLIEFSVEGTPGRSITIEFSPDSKKIAVGGAASASSISGSLQIFSLDDTENHFNMVLNEYYTSVASRDARCSTLKFIDNDNLVSIGYRYDNNERRMYKYEYSTSWEENVEIIRIPSIQGGMFILEGSYLIGIGNYGNIGLVEKPGKFLWSDYVAVPLARSKNTLWPSMANDGNLLFTVVGEESEYTLGLFARRGFINQQSYSRQWTFPAGVGTGTVNRVGLQANSGTGENGNNRHVAQIVLPEPLEKTELHQLDVIWEIEVENPGVWEGVIPGGSRDGSDLAWRVTINDEQFYQLVQTGYGALANWFGVTGTPNVRIGTSNEESDLIFDRGNISGEEIEYISSTAIRVVNPYVLGSLKRTIRLFLEVDQGNGQIGEIVLGGSSSSSSLARITFDPPLDKPPHEGEGANPYRIYLDLEIGWQRG